MSEPTSLSEPLIKLAATAILIGPNDVFVAAEFALVRARSGRIAALAESGSAPPSARCFSKTPRRKSSALYPTKSTRRPPRPPYRVRTLAMAKRRVSRVGFERLPPEEQAAD